MKWKIVFAIAAVVAQTCSAQDTPTSSADQRYENLKTAINIGEQTVSSDIGDDRVTEAMASVGWLEGVYDTLQVNASAKYPMAICPPKGLSGLSLARVYTNYMDADPKAHGMEDLAVAMLSAMKAFPCPASSRN